MGGVRAWWPSTSGRAQSVGQVAAQVGLERRILLDQKISLVFACIYIEREMEICLERAAKSAGARREILYEDHD